ncbi:uncharacterized protein LOC111592851 [Drosophila hydei]|uniref:Uncharacterized protein LOC111592851 n=1 Tax=Drosophila hydei TaxID=7224 RepID=A0A6J1LCY1_DROHY|nr:uncharacterized protein LOC111592851 [Drosophila hydei]
MIKEPDEKRLDRHFRQQLEEYDTIFKQEACVSDQCIISCWLQIFKAAPKAEKWARNSLMLLMYGHLKEVGYLQVPFTDRRNVGRNLNEILDGYSGLPVTNNDKYTRVLTPVREEGTPSQTEAEDLTKASEEFTPKSQTSKQLLRAPSNIAENTLDDGSNGHTTSFASLSQNSHNVLYDTFDSHTCYLHKGELDECAAESRRMLAVEAVIQSMQRLNRTSLDVIPEEGANTVTAEDHCYAKLVTNIFKANKKKYNERQLEENTSSLGSSEPMAEPKATVARPKATVLIKPTSRRSTAREPPVESARREACDAELMFLRQRNKQLRRECLIYYHKNGNLRKHPKYPKPKLQTVGFLVSAYRAHYHFTRWHPQISHRFPQEYSRTNGWRTYRNILLASAVPRCILRQVPDSERSCTTHHIPHISPVKMGDSRISTYELHYLLARLKAKKLSIGREFAL